MTMLIITFWSAEQRPGDEAYGHEDVCNDVFEIPSGQNDNKASAGGHVAPSETTLTRLHDADSRDWKSSSERQLDKTASIKENAPLMIDLQSDHGSVTFDPTWAACETPWVTLSPGYRLTGRSLVWDVWKGFRCERHTWQKVTNGLLDSSVVRDGGIQVGPQSHVIPFNSSPVTKALWPTCVYTITAWWHERCH